MLTHTSGMQRIDIRRELADRSLRGGDFEDAVKHLDAAAEEALLLGDQSTAAEMYRRWGVAGLEAEEWEGSLAAFRRSAECSAAVGKDSQRVWSLVGASEALNRLGRFTDSLEATEGLSAVVESEADLLGEVAQQRCRSHYFLGQWEEALAECSRAREAFRRAGLVDEVIRADDHALSIHLELGEVDRALEIAANSHKVALANADYLTVALMDLWLAEIYLKRDEPETALGHAEQARELHGTARDTLGIARADSLRGSSLLELGRLTEAEQAFVDARILYHSIGDDAAALGCEADLAQVLHDRGEYAAAAEVYERLARAYAERGMRLEQGVAGFQQAENYLEGGDPESAVDLVERLLAEFDGGLDPAADAAEAPNLRFVRANLVAVQARALAVLGDEAKARRLAEQVIAETDADDVNHNTAWMYEIVAAALRASGSEDAMRVLAQAVALHLFKGSTERALELAQQLLPEPRPGIAPSDGGVLPRPAAAMSTGGYL